MAFTRTFPYDIGTFVLVDDELGVIACYQCVNEDDELVVMVSGYKNAWCKEFLLNEIRLATQKEVDTYKDIMGIKE